GDVTTSGSNVVTLATVATAGTNTKITYNAKGLVTSGTQAAASDLSNGTTGGGAVVLAVSPTLVSPALGTPSSVVLTNATGLPLSTGVTGQLPIANVGTSGSTGSGALVLAISPTITTPTISGALGGNLDFGSYAQTTEVPN